MKQFDFEVQSPVGIHARPAVLLVEKARTYQSKITLEKGSQRANAQKYDISSDTQGSSA